MTDERSPAGETPRPHPGWWWGWAGIGLALGLSWLVMVLMPWPRCDFEAYYRAAARVSAGESPYRVDDLGIWHTYRYPPAFAYLMIPFTHADLATAGRVWFGFNLLAVAGCVLLSLYLVMGPRPWPSGAVAVALLAYLPCSFYVAQNLFQGQVGLLVGLGCLGWAACRRAGRNFTGGLLLAAGCALKLAPVVLVPYLVLRNDRRGLAGVVVGGALFALVPVPWLGIDGTAELHRDWFRHAHETQAAVQNYRPGNQGLMGMLARLPAVSNGRVLYSEQNLALLDRHYSKLVAGLAVVLYGWIARDLWARRWGGTGGDRENLHVSLLIIFMTLAHPCAWRCNFVLLLLPAMMLARHAHARRPGSAVAWVVLAVVALSWVWSVLTLVVRFAEHWRGFGGASSLIDVIRGKVADDGWSVGMWVLHGAHFWTALLVGWACWRLSGPAAPEAPRPLPPRSRLG